METLNIKQLKQENKLAFKELFKNSKYSIQTYINNNKEIELAIIVFTNFTILHEKQNPIYKTEFPTYNKNTNTVTYQNEKLISRDMQRLTKKLYQQIKE